jgi:pimeloyl-ACP methyl ester carboxylesterase
MTTSDATAATTNRTIALPDGATLRVSEYGSGDHASEPLVLVCGTTQSQRLWAPLLPALSASYRVITYDHRGIGDSTRGGGSISMASLADDLAALLDGLGLPRGHVLGWSLGSTVAQELALRHPQRVAGLVLAGTWGRTDMFQACVFTGLGHPWRTGHRDVALAALGIAFSPELLASPQFPAMMQQLEPLFPKAPAQMETVAEQWDADLAHDALERLDQITAPTLVIAAEHDLLTPSGQGRAVADRIRGARFELLTGPGASHAVLLERPDEFTGLVLDFLATKPLSV